jgi:DNA-binding SARP family transcriptional activator
LLFELLGPLQVRGEDRVVAIKGARQRALLSRLVLAVDHVISVESLSETLWGYEPPSTYRTQIAICVASLRKTFREIGGERAILTSHPGYLLPARGHRIDANIFEDQVARAKEAHAQRQFDRAARLLTEALALWRGSALAGVTGAMIEAEAAYLDEQRLQALELLAAVRLEQGEYVATIKQLTTMVHENPYREQARANLMLAQYRSGQRAEALATFREARNWSVQELGLEPGPVLRELHDAILQGDTVAVVTPVADRPTVIPRQLPSKTRSLTGRDHEIAQLRRLLPGAAESQVMVGLISGPAGVGKTALALRWASDVIDAFPDGQLYVNLNGYSTDSPPLTAEAVIERFLRALSVPPDRMPTAADERQALYNTMMSGRRLLIVLDNVDGSTQIQSLLPGSETCRVLITSRRQLSELNGLVDIRLNLVPLSAESSVELLAHAAGDDRVVHDWASALEVAGLCGYLPLALEAAGTRLASRPYWTVRDFCRRLADERLRLDELGSGKESVRASLYLSYQKLPPRCQRIFCGLARLRAQPFSAQAGAELLATTKEDMENQLAVLYDEHLVIALPRGSDGGTEYALPELAKLLAAELAQPGTQKAVR